MADTADVRFRRPVLEDFEALLALLNDPASVHQQRPGIHARQPEDPAQLYDRLLEDENLVAEVDGRIAGYASWQYFERHVHLNVMSVAGAFQRRGIGQALFCHFVDLLHDEGVESVSLRAFRDSSWALAFYEKMGMHRYEAGMEESSDAEGLRHYIRMSAAQGQWPDVDKVMFYALIGD